MAKKTAALMPSSQARLARLGERLRLARRRRRLTAQQVAARAGMAPMTLRAVERGGTGVTIGAYVAVLQVLGLEADLDQVAAADPQGRTLQDAPLSAPHAVRVKPRVRASKSTVTLGRDTTAWVPPLVSTTRLSQTARDRVPDWQATERFASSVDLASAIRIPKRRGRATR